MAPLTATSPNAQRLTRLVNQWARWLPGARQEGVRLDRRTRRSLITGTCQNIYCSNSEFAWFQDSVTRAARPSSAVCAHGRPGCQPATSLGTICRLPGQ
ncbi:hypothetical protein BRADI_1g48573v3 [Brachypodium distachyon]|uniref:Uncharacterized protein n=1 Tax=Brachypodium distachyon TaxID=15368 RepID=A0A0Q3H8Y9_BRADI|nr:hypothetical protein BRADI_1g48573v3 [Brachypodium distachyon]